MKNTVKARLEEVYDELKWLYMELYNNDQEAFSYFTDMLMRSYDGRRAGLKKMDEARLADPDWYRSNKIMGMMLYVDLFAGDLAGVKERLSYFEELGINYIHLMPLLDTVPEKSDGGYAVTDFRKVREDLGTMKDLEELSKACHKRGISLCLDFVMNHTGDEHAWAKAARAGDTVAKGRYFFFDSWDLPAKFEASIPDVFPTTAPGSFTWLDDCNQAVMTMFYPFQWDLNYSNPLVLNDMTENLLFLANRGMDIIRLDAIPYIWKALGTDCRNLPQVHTIARILYLSCYVVCPGVLMLGEVVMEPKKVAAYFGTEDRPECRMLYNVTTMCSTWHTLATRDVRLLKHQMDQVCALPPQCIFQNYLRCHDDIGWGLDYPFLSQFGIGEVAHKRYLNDFFIGRFSGSWSRGELYNEDLRLGDARLCGTTASLCGLESAGTEEEAETALRRDLMLHAFMLAQSGIPVLYSGDEIGQLNDYSYHQDPKKADDSRNVHRGKFNWELAELRKDPETVNGRLYGLLKKLIRLRSENEVFRSDAHVHTFWTGSDSVLGIYREYDGKGLVGLFNFSEWPIPVYYPDGTDLMSGNKIKAGDSHIDGYGFVWLATGENNEQEA